MQRDKRLIEFEDMGAGELQGSLVALPDGAPPEVEIWQALLFYMGTQHMGHQMFACEVGEPLRARGIDAEIFNSEQARIQTVAGEQVPGQTVIESNAGFLVAGEWDYVDDPSAQVNVPGVCRPFGDFSVLLNLRGFGIDELDVGKRLQLFV